MPRTRTDSEKRNDNRRNLIVKWLADCGSKKQFLGKIIGGGQQLGYHRFQNPADLTIEEVNLMCKTKNLSDLQIVCLVRGLKYEEEPKNEIKSN